MKLWTFFDRAADVVLNAAADTLDAVGSLSCIAGGSGFMASYAINEEVSLSYFGRIEADGLANITIDSKMLDLYKNQTLPFHHVFSKEGEDRFNLNEFITPNSVQVLSVLCISTGSLLKLAGAQMKYWSRSREDIKYFRKDVGLELDKPSWGEYIDIARASVCSSMAYTFFSAGIVGTCIEYSGLRSTKTITYPLEGNPYKQGSDYKGPVTRRVYPVEGSYTDKDSIKLPFLPEPIEVEAHIHVKANVTIIDGAEIVLKSETGPSPYSPALIVVGASAQLAGNFFNHRANKERDRRIHFASPETGYSLNAVVFEV